MEPVFVIMRCVAQRTIGKKPQFAEIIRLVVLLEEMMILIAIRLVLQNVVTPKIIEFTLVQLERHVAAPVVVYVFERIRMAF
jgi:hypothetical protein